MSFSEQLIAWRRELHQNLNSPVRRSKQRPACASG